MSFTAQTKHYWEQLPHNEQYTSFKLDLTEYSIFHQFYDQLKSKFIISNTDHECHLQWTNKEPVYFPSLYDDEELYNQAVVLLEFPKYGKFDKMKIIVSILDENGRKIISKSMMKDNACSLTFRMTDSNDLDAHSTIEKYLHNDTLTLFCELVQTQITQIKSILIDNTQIRAPSFDNNVAKKLKEFFETKDICDLTILVEDEEFHAHKIVLAANSPVFDAMFTVGMKEQIENIVTITDIDAATFEAFLRYMYTGTVERNDNQVRDLLVVADKYEVVNLVNLCKAYIANELKTRTEHYWRQCPDTKEHTSIIWNLKRFDELREFDSNSPSQLVITNTDYECELKIVYVEHLEVSVHVLFPEDCKLALKVIVSFVDGLGKKLKTKSSMKREQTNSLQFSMDNYSEAIHSDSGDLTILCEIIYVDLTPIKSTVVESKIQDKNLSNYIAKTIEQVFNTQCFCDVTVVAKGAEIHAHKVVLAANSPVFKTMFSENAVEQIRNTITIDDSDATTVKAFLTFMYTGSVRKTEQLLKDLLILGKKYQVLDLVTLCENYTEMYLNPNNVNALIASPLCK